MNKINYYRSDSQSLNQPQLLLLVDVNCLLLPGIDTLLAVVFAETPAHVNKLLTMFIENKKCLKTG